ncbi:hypothetical protein [Ruegeria aquimaris]|uniref:Glycosyltransferase n=1 Tax=Ruegeria aquimaris TaxID=2984333 RepID=A0ABT3AR73_9RHOB|nr:hypothetical protein [Ruegeria sp. XHP0148]MCV2891184.1 hypothetical protein [Ruegeria sp. XHP0148]
MKYDFLIAASLTDGFCGQIAFFRLCLNALGGEYAKSRLVAVFGDPETEELPERWKPYFEGIEVAWAYSASGDPVAEGYAAQHLKRFELIRPDCDLAFLCDADVAPIRPFREMALDLMARSALGGVIAHFHFPLEGRKLKDRLPDVDWPRIAQEILGHDIKRPYRYTLTPLHTPPQAPFYINYGVLAGPPKSLGAFCRAAADIREALHACVGPWWGPQVEVPLAADRAGLETRALPMRYNFPNDPRADTLYPDDLEEIVFLHYLRQNLFRRDRIFASRDEFDRFMGLALTGSNAVFQAHVRAVTAGHYPFERDATDIRTLKR